MPQILDNANDFLQVTAPHYVVLLHYPVTNRHGLVVTTAVTNLDIHDLARTSRTFGAKKFFIVTPIEEQHQLVSKILDHWKTDEARSHHPDRVEALSIVCLARDFEEVKQSIRSETGRFPRVWMPDARPIEGSESYAMALKKREMTFSDDPLVVVFGTGWGLAQEFFKEVHTFLEPIEGKDYNHLSVRAAAAIVMDRLFGRN